MRWGGDWDLVYPLLPCGGSSAGIVGARLYHVITSWDEVPDEWWGVFAVWKGGLGVWGGVAARRRCRRHRRAARGRERPAARRRGRARASCSRRRSAGSATTSTRSSSASRPTSLGARDRPGEPPGRLRARRDLPSDLPLRDHLGRRSASSACCAARAPSTAGRRLLPLRHVVLARPRHLGGAAPRSTRPTTSRACGSTAGSRSASSSAGLAGFIWTPARERAAADGGRRPRRRLASPRR